MMEIFVARPGEAKLVGKCIGMLTFFVFQVIVTRLKIVNGRVFRLGLFSECRYIGTAFLVFRGF
jgi:hypothetical protein